MGAKFLFTTIDSVQEFLNANYPRYKILEYNLKEKSKFLDTQRNIEFYCFLNYLKVHLKKDKDFLFSPSKEERELKRAQTIEKNYGTSCLFNNPEIRQKTIEKNTKYSIEKDWLYDQYWNNQLSKSQIAKLVGCGTTTIDSYMRKYEIPFRTMSDATKISNNVEEKKKEFSKLWTGNKLSEETKQKISQSRIGKYTGENSPCWKPPEERRTPLNLAIRACDKNIEWKKAVMARDKYTCIKCACIDNLEIDHIVPLSYLIKENNIKTLEDARVCDKLWDISNGRVLCEKCHKETDTYSFKALKYQLQE